MTAERLQQPARLRSLKLGEVTVSYVPDGAVQLRPRAWLPASTDDDWAAHPDYLDDTGNLVAGIGGLLVERGDRALLIDAGVGPVSMPAQPDNPFGAIHGGALLDNLATLGRDPSEIEAVAITHLHLDHIGWASAFAEVLLTEPEWTQRHLAEARGTSRETLDALAPRVRTVSDGEEIFPGVRVLLTAGHTAGHASYVLTEGDQRLIAFGDALHSPIQIANPSWSAAPDHDTVRSAEWRHRLVEELAKPDTIGFGIHFADVVFGRVDTSGDRPVWSPVATLPDAGAA
jgi:glyoxylase-like metal-dependent hydrolase (beta-lactamase superfamily II)